jgi:ABC-2 type transport system ATP-binding protein
MIKIENLTFAYGKKKPNVIEDLSLTLHPGAIYGLLGKNGTGKSTLFYLLSGLLFPDEGKVMMNDINVTNRQLGTLQDIYILPEEFDAPKISFEKYVRLHAPLYPRFDHEQLGRCMAEFELPMDVDLKSLSMGQKKKAMLCFALATGTRLLLLDEPTNGLDIPSKAVFRRVVTSCMNDERIIIISTHQVRDVEYLLDRVILLKNSKLHYEGATADITERLSFAVVPTTDVPQNVIYQEPNLAGTAVVYPNPGGEETVLNLELFFNALSVQPDLVERYLKA